MPILRAAKLANCSTLEIVQLILDKRLTQIRVAPAGTGFLSVFVDPAEVEPLVRRDLQFPVTAIRNPPLHQSV